MSEQPPEPPPEEPYQIPGTHPAWEPDTLPNQPMKAKDVTPFIPKVVD